MKKLITILFAVAVLGTSCQKWLDVNHNPNDATKATPELILPGVLNNWLSSQLDFSTTPGAWMGYWYHMGGWSGWYEVKKYDVSTNFANYFGYYTGPLTDTKFIRDNCGTNKIYPAITNLIDAWYYARLIDIYGDVPYSEACNPGVTLNPKYDDAQTIYLSLIHRLNQSIAVFNKKANDPTTAADPDYNFVKGGDIVFAGDFSKWLKFANTLKLRYVMRMSNTKTIANWKTEMDSTASYGFITTNVTGNPGYSVSSGKTNPWYSNYGYSYNNVLASANTQYGLNAYLYTKLTRLADPRLTQYFWAPTGSGTPPVLIATVFGKDGDLVVQPNQTRAGNYSHVFIANDYTGPTGNPLKNSGSGHTDPARLFLASESYFLQAEARVRGILTTGLTADVAYTNGVTASLTESKVAAGAQTTYLASPDVLWDVNWDVNQQLSHILNQKWIANFFLNMFESWCDYRRTGYPNPLHPGFTNDVTDANSEMLTYYPSGIIRRQIPRIIDYPQAEFDLNKAQVQAAVDKQIQKNGVTFTNTSYPFDARVFWDTAPKTITY